MEETGFSQQELQRYSRHLLIPGFNIEGQRKLKEGKVLVVGAGGLGAPLLYYLAAAGVGTIGIVDDDRVDETNLQRQVLFTTDDIGKPKVESAKKKLLLLNPFINIKVFNTRLTSKNALEIIGQFDVVADGTDNFPTRYLVNDACVLLNKTNVYASIYRFEGQISVFNFRENGITGPNYRDLFPEPPPPHTVPSCAEGGVLGVLPGIIGAMQANEVIKIITGIGEPLSGKLFLFDALKFETRLLSISRDENNPLNGKNPTLKNLIDYDLFCGFVPADEEDVGKINEITPRELEQWMQNHTDFYLIDVREPFEHELVNIGGELISLKNIPGAAAKIPRNKKVVFYCKSGRRSKSAIELLRERFGFNNLYNLKGGIMKWAEEIDPEMIRY
ncbi:MAG: molybdopterin-synthase adenylyltransferase MoeB [Bacteroidetes bacterium]|nr:molybdopterin-synthase adenylyltransferase MoeB [Bacteroidota bacterium]